VGWHAGQSFGAKQPCRYKETFASHREEKPFSRTGKHHLYSSYIIEKIVRGTHIALFLPKRKPSLDIPEVYISSLWIQQQIDALAYSGVVAGPFAGNQVPYWLDNGRRDRQGPFCSMLSILGSSAEKSLEKSDCWIGFLESTKVHSN
jgi:hypothetical protein